MDQHPKKLTVYAYSNKELTDNTGNFVLPLNPEQYAQTFKVEYDAQPAEGAQGAEPRFKSSAPEELDLDFVFDSTNTAYGYGRDGQSVPAQIDEFKQIVYNLEGSIHQPRYLKLVWKDFVFDCILTELQVTYTLFDSEGTPIRAKLSCGFLNYKETERRVREEGKSSPDLTHVRTVEDAQNLPLLTHEIYGVPKHYMEIALANDLTAFRTLTTGTTLVFPPLSEM